MQGSEKYPNYENTEIIFQLQILSWKSF